VLLRLWLIAACMAAILGSAPMASAQDDDAALTPAEPDVVVVNLPTTLRLPSFKGNFRLTHRFEGNLRTGTFGQQAGNLFGIDQGAIIGFEYRVGLPKGAQAAFYRSSFDKTIQLHGEYGALRQQHATPVSLSALVSIEGTDNFQEQFAPAVGVVVSRRFATRAAVYLTPVWVHNSAASSHEHRDTTYIGTGGRLRFVGSAYVTGEIAFRASGYAPDKPAYGVSLEKRVGAHMFSLTFTNTFGTTFAQLARGGTANTLFLGFNLGRKFF
jgi:hypothetical protein